MHRQVNILLFRGRYEFLNYCNYFKGNYNLYRMLIIFYEFTLYIHHILHTGIRHAQVKAKAKIYYSVPGFDIYI